MDMAVIAVLAGGAAVGVVAAIAASRRGGPPASGAQRDLADAGFSLDPHPHAGHAPDRRLDPVRSLSAFGGRPERLHWAARGSRAGRPLDVRVYDEVEAGPVGGWAARGGRVALLEIDTPCPREWPDLRIDPTLVSRLNRPPPDAERGQVIVQLEMDHRAEKWVVESDDPERAGPMVGAGVRGWLDSRAVFGLYRVGGGRVAGLLPARVCGPGDALRLADAVLELERELRRAMMEAGR